MTYKQPGTRGILQVFPLSLQSRRFTGMSEKERINFALEQVEMIYSGMRQHFEGGVTKCWDEDEWARGTTYYYKPGQFSSLAGPEAPTSERERIELLDVVRGFALYGVLLANPVLC